MTTARPVALATVALGALIATVVLLNRPPAGPVEPVWDRDACAHCHMHLGERGFAAQALTAAGETLFFDDPGCLLLWRQAQATVPVAIYFHHLDQDRWLRDEETGFVPASSTPMNWGLAAVDRTTPGALSVAEASRQLVASAARAASNEMAGGGSAP